MGWSGILSTILGMTGDYFEGRRRVAQARVEAEVQVQTQRLAADISWDNIQADNSARSWKDEWFTILLSLPVIGIFIPQLQPYVMAGFEGLNDVPEWYLAAFGLAVAASFGYREIISRVTSRQPQTSQAAPVA
jgi:hypothetical protein